MNRFHWEYETTNTFLLDEYQSGSTNGWLEVTNNCTFCLKPKKCRRFIGMWQAAIPVRYPTILWHYVMCHSWSAWAWGITCPLQKFRRNIAFRVMQRCLCPIWKPLLLVTIDSKNCKCKNALLKKRWNFTTKALLAWTASKTMNAIPTCRAKRR